MVYLFLLAAIVQLGYWAWFFCYAYRSAASGPMVVDPESKVSIIVCFRNEEENLQRCIDLILAQSFSGQFELILVDDNSTDQSASIAHPYVIRNEHVRLLEPGPTRPGKKDALAYGINHARYEHLLLIDADCVPASSHWLWYMTEPLRLGQELVLGVSPLFPGKQTGLLGYWQWFESVYISLKYLGFAYRNQPYMGVGRNLAYTKSFFLRAGGFVGHEDLASGDDDLLVAGNAMPGRTARVVNSAAWTQAKGQPTWRDYFRQRGRHQSTGTRYPKKTAWSLGGVALSHGVFYLLGFYLLFTPWSWLAIGGYLLRLFYLLQAYHRPFLYYDPAFYGEFDTSTSLSGTRSTGSETAAAAGAVVSWKSRVGLIGLVIAGDALVGPMYLYLALRTLLPGRGW